MRLEPAPFIWLTAPLPTLSPEGERGFLLSLFFTIDLYEKDGGEAKMKFWIAIAIIAGAFVVISYIWPILNPPPPPDVLMVPDHAPKYDPANEL